MKDKYIFDLDYTLYSSYDHIDTEDEHEYYSSFKEKSLMTQLLKKLDNKYIITNGTKSHAEAVLSNMKLDNIFSNNSIISRDDMKGTMKPYPLPYLIANKKFDIKYNDNVYFFEDMIDNLIIAKKYFGWKTILIDPKMKSKPYGVDYLFNTIENALVHFHGKKKI